MKQEQAIVGVLLTLGISFALAATGTMAQFCPEIFERFIFYFCTPFILLFAIPALPFGPGTLATVVVYSSGFLSRIGSIYLSHWFFRRKSFRFNLLIDVVTQVPIILIGLIFVFASAQ